MSLGLGEERGMNKWSPGDFGGSETLLLNTLLAEA